MPRTKTSSPETADIELDDFLSDDVPEAAPVEPVEIGTTFTPEPGTRIISKSLIPELYRFARNIQADAPYDQLSMMAQSAGWIWRLVERSTTSTPFGSYLVQFDVLVGKATADLSLEYFDTISMSVPAEAPSPSLIARLNAQVALIYMVFGRLPPQPVQAPAATPAPQVERPAPAPSVPWQNEVAEAKEIDIVGNFTPDGLPILVDLYAYKADPGDIVEAAISTLQDALVNVTTQAGLSALWGKNEMAVEFIKDFGEKRHKERLAKMFKDRANELRRNA